MSVPTIIRSPETVTWSPNLELIRMRNPNILGNIAAGLNASIGDFASATTANLDAQRNINKDILDGLKAEAAVKQADATVANLESEVAKRDFDRTRMEAFDTAIQNQGIPHAVMNTGFGAGLLLEKGENPIQFMRMEAARNELTAEIQRAQQENRPVNIDGLSLEAQNLYWTQQKAETEGRAAKIQAEAQVGQDRFRQYIGQMRSPSTDITKPSQWDEFITKLQQAAKVADTTEINNLLTSQYKKYQEQYHDKEGRYLSESSFRDFISKEFAGQLTPPSLTEGVISNITTGLEELDKSLSSGANLLGVPVSEIVKMSEDKVRREKFIEDKINEITGNNPEQNNVIRQNLKHLITYLYDKKGKVLTTPETLLVTLAALDSAQQDKNLLNVLNIRQIFSNLQSLGNGTVAKIKEFQNEADRNLDLYNRNKRFFEVIGKLFPAEEFERLKSSIRATSQLVPALPGNENLPAHILATALTAKMRTLEKDPAYKNLNPAQQNYIKQVIRRLNGETRTIGQSVPFNAGPKIPDSKSNQAQSPDDFARQLSETILSIDLPRE